MVLRVINFKASPISNNWNSRENEQGQVNKIGNNKFWIKWLKLIEITNTNWVFFTLPLHISRVPLFLYKSDFSWNASDTFGSVPPKVWSAVPTDRQVLERDIVQDVSRTVLTAVPPAQLLLYCCWHHLQHIPCGLSMNESGKE